MSITRRPTDPLTPEQRVRVQGNLGLIAVHLKRYVPSSQRPAGGHEWKDLFQEGCIGLMEAAKSFDPDRGIEFAAYALPRIHRAVSDALRRKQPAIRQSNTRIKCSKSVKNDPDRPRVYSLSGGWEDSLSSRKKQDRSDPTFNTVGERLYEKYQRAVKSSVADLTAVRAIRDDRGKLIRDMVEKRLLVAEKENRTGLRTLARQTGSSFARVSECEKKLGSSIRRKLESDPEFAELKRQARTSSIGMDLPVEPGLERRLAVKSAGAFLKTFRRLHRQDQARVLLTLLEFSQVNIETLIRSTYPQLAASLRDMLQDEVTRETGSNSKKSCTEDQVVVESALNLPARNNKG
ncbi:MAG: sigma-70 family RNA polymerase sigma factor [Planctomycetota bacterium]